MGMWASSSGMCGWDGVWKVRLDVFMCVWMSRCRRMWLCRPVYAQDRTCWRTGRCTAAGGRGRRPKGGDGGWPPGEANCQKRSRWDSLDPRTQDVRKYRLSAGPAGE